MRQPARRMLRAVARRESGPSILQGDTIRPAFPCHQRISFWYLCRATLATILISLLGIVPSVTSAQSGPVITVNTAAASGTLTTQLSTNLTWPYSVSQTPGAQALLSAYAPPLVRIHVGTDGPTPALPAAKTPESWDFAALDDLVNTVGAYGGDPVLNVRHAPDWMWSCTTYRGVGDIKDLTFMNFAD